jgi:hypothetical protein
MVAKGTFLYYTFASYPCSRIGELPGRIVVGKNSTPDFLCNLSGRWSPTFNQRLIVTPEMVHLFLVGVNYAIRAVDDAIAATNALIRVVHSDITICLMHGSSRASIDARGLRTVIAECRNILVFDIGKLTNGTADSASPGNVFFNIVFVFTGDDASPTTDTSLKVDYHSQPLA